MRGIKRSARGHRLTDEVGAGRVVLGYRGLDAIVRRTEIEFSPAPEKLSASRAYLHRVLSPGGREQFAFTYMFKVDNKHGGRLPGEGALDAAARSLKAKADHSETLTSNEQFNRWLEQSAADLHMMLTETPHGIYPYAGVPWFSDRGIEIIDNETRHTFFHQFRHGAVPVSDSRRAARHRFDEHQSEWLEPINGEE